MIEVTRTTYHVRCEWSNCQTVGPKAVLRSEARQLAADQGWRMIGGGPGGKSIDICPWCYREYRKR